MMTAIESPLPNVQGGRLWPLGVKAYHALGELGLIPEKTELLYGQVFHKMSKSPLHRFLVMRLLAILQRVVPTGFHVQVEQGPEEHIEVHCQPQDGEYTDRALHGPPATVTSDVFPGSRWTWPGCSPLEGSVNSENRSLHARSVSGRPQGTRPLQLLLAPVQSGECGGHSRSLAAASV